MSGETSTGPAGDFPAPQYFMGFQTYPPTSAILHRFDDESLAALRELTAALKGPRTPGDVPPLHMDPETGKLYVHPGKP